MGDELVKDFDFYAGGIEDAMLVLLEQELRPLGVKTFATYSGELDSDNLKKAIGDLSPQFPLVMVSYTDGKDIQLPRQSAVLGKPRQFQHECSFAVICASNDSRGDKSRRRGALVGSKKTGVYQMLSTVRSILTDLRLKINIEGAEHLLTYDPLMPSGTEFIARIPQVTAYAQIFDTFFKYQSLDRSVAGIPVSEFVLDVESLNDLILPEVNLPGVKIV